jgi:heme oxygenase
MSLKELTAEKHRLAESTPFMKSVFAGTMSKEIWADYTFQKMFWYRSIEKKSQELGLLEGIEQIRRADLIQEDLYEMAGDFYVSKQPNPITQEYVDYINSLKYPRAVLAHLYTWHMGDMFGGQMIKKLIDGPHKHLDFENVQELMSRFRSMLGNDLADEANIAFDWAIKILNRYEC